MAEATAEAHTAPVADSKPESNGAEKSSSGGAEKSNGGDENVSARGEAKRVHDEDNPERYDSRDKRERGGDRRDDRRGGRDGGRGRGRGRGNGRGGRGRGFGGRGGSRGDYHKKDGVRTDYSRKEESSDQTEIRRQVEFYFSESNLPIDKFLLEETGGPENKPFPLKTLHNFKRMRHFQPFSAVVEAVKGSDFLEVNDQDEVYRKQPLDSKFTTDVKKNSELLTSVSMNRSIYVKGFGDETRTTVFDIEEFFAPYGTRGVRLRRHEDGTFKGSVFVEFVDADSAKQFLDMEEKPKFNDKELEVMSKQQYVEGKNQAILEGTVKPKSPTRYGSNRNNNANRERRGSFQGKRKRENDEADDNGDTDNWRSRREKFQRGGGRDGRDRSASRSRSRSPWQAKKDGGEEVKKEDAAATETKKEDAPADVKAEEPASTTETKKEAEETTA